MIFERNWAVFGGGTYVFNVILFLSSPSLLPTLLLMYHLSPDLSGYFDLSLMPSVVMVVIPDETMAPQGCKHPLARVIVKIGGRS